VKSKIKGCSNQNVNVKGRKWFTTKQKCKIKRNFQSKKKKEGRKTYKSPWSK